MTLDLALKESNDVIDKNNVNKYKQIIYICII